MFKIIPNLVDIFILTSSSDSNDEEKSDIEQGNVTHNLGSLIQ